MQSTAMPASCYLCAAETESGAIESGGPTTIAELPPMASPNRAVMRSQAATGTVVVVGLTVLLVSVPRMVAGDALTNSIGTIFLYVEAAVAGVCLLGILFGDPGTLKRSPEACFPIPEQVMDRLRRGAPLDLENVYHDGMVYCVRCFIWRRAHNQVHHCSICQRCVVDFDHHCGVFGRCIAGRGFRGNMGYFKSILLMALAGIITSIATVSVGSDA